MDLETFSNLISWYHNDESQLIVIMGTMVGLVGATVGMTFVENLKKPWKYAVAASSLVVYAVLWLYSNHLSDRMGVVRNSLAQKGVPQDVAQYGSEIVRRDWYVLYPTLFMVILLSVYVVIAIGIIRRSTSVKLPDINR